MAYDYRVTKSVYTKYINVPTNLGTVRAIEPCAGMNQINVNGTFV